ncbi:UNVERIFIED_CONTAM: hypothetical protein PYX00_001504 [Menopon gallinae]|uniref:FLYWCH-type domain-containing protein n=1 Tax=Menopon gallinae TaxID=328185 RepID=A0AAW2ID96_9NEOP
MIDFYKLDDWVAGNLERTSANALDDKALIMFGFRCNFEVRKTTQGKPKLIHRGHEFVMAYSCKKNPLKYWRCSKRGSCGARAVLQEAGQLILTRPHNQYCGGHTIPNSNSSKVPGAACGTTVKSR